MGGAGAVREVNRRLYGDNPYFRQTSVRRAKALDFGAACAYYNRCVTDVQGWTFSLVGALPPEDELTKLLERSPGTRAHRRRGPCEVRRVHSAHRVVPAHA